MNATLLILAAGLGSRFGGDKQIDKVGPNGELLMEYSIHDAIKAGLNKVVFILKEEMIETVKREVGDKLGDKVEVCYAVQDFTKAMPDGFTVPADRTKPFGTVHAVLCAKEYLTEPFATVNADDYYGTECFEIMYDYLGKVTRDNAAMVTYILKNTISENGAVTRGICTTANGELVRVDETGGIIPKEGFIDSERGEIDPDSEVSMNFWGFASETLDRMTKYFEDFCGALTPEQIKAECLLPIKVNDLLATKELSVMAKPSNDKWFGITYKADKEDVENKLRDLHSNGAYPEKL